MRIFLLICTHTAACALGILIMGKLSLEEAPEAAPARLSPAPEAEKAPTRAPAIQEKTAPNSGHPTLEERHTQKEKEPPTAIDDESADDEPHAPEPQTPETSAVIADSEWHLIKEVTIERPGQSAGWFVGQTAGADMWATWDCNGWERGTDPVQHIGQTIKICGF